MEKTKSPVVLQGEKIDEEKKTQKKWRKLYSAELLRRVTAIVGINIGVPGRAGVSVK